jgi:hypothetical protein
MTSPIDNTGDTTVGICPADGCDTRFMSHSESEVRRDLFLHTEIHRGDRKAKGVRELCRKWLSRRGFPIDMRM